MSAPVPTTRHRFVLRLASELTRKSNKTRRRFQRQLCRNLAAALRSQGCDFEIEDRWSRIFIDVDRAGAIDVVRRVFGVNSFSRVDATLPADLDQICQVGHDLFAPLVKGRTFAVAARRTGRHSFSSQDVREQLGAALNPYATVDLSNPEVTVSVEIREGEAFLFHDRTKGPGGLPIGTQGTAVCLISGGFDSAVAAWLLLKRGVKLEYVFCNLAGPAFERSVVQVTKVLSDGWSHGDAPKVHVVDFESVVADLQAKVTPRYWQVVLKRQMYRAAEAVAEEINADAIITGEALGQVSSQTLGNLRAIDAVTTLPVFRPLIGLDKGEIIALAERIGTSALSARIKEYCAILEGKPVTNAKVGAVDREEAPVEAELLVSAVKDRSVLALNELGKKDLSEPYLYLDDVPADALVMDCRLPSQDDGWRHPGSKRVTAEDFPNFAKGLDKDRSYILFCDNGVQSTRFAELLQRVGYEAYSLRGGTQRLRRTSTGAGGVG